MNRVEKPRSAERSLVPQRITSISFSVGNCQYCDYLPTMKEVDQHKDVDHLYHCPRCGFPMEFLSILSLVDRFYDEMDLDAKLLDSYANSQEHVVR